MICKNCKTNNSTLNITEANQLLNTLKNGNNFALTQNYAHHYNLCKKCMIVINNFNEEEFKILNKNANNIKNIYNNYKFLWLDKNKWALNCELAGYEYELISNHEQAGFAYMAAADLFDILLTEYVVNFKKDVKLVNNDLSKNLENKNIKLINEAMDYLQNLRSLALGHILKVQNSNNLLLLYNYISLMIDLNDIENAVPALNNLKKAVEKLGEPHLSIIKCLENKIEQTLKATTINIDLN